MGLDPAPPLAAADVGKALGRLRGGRPHGAVGWSPKEWRRLPPAAHHQLADVILTPGKAMTMPAQNDPLP